MGNQIKKLQQSAIEQISKIIGDTSEGLTGSELGQLLIEKGIVDIDPHNTKWRRLYSALLNDHNVMQCSNRTLNFIIHVMRPDRYLNDIERFNNRRRQLNEVLSVM